MPKYRIDLLLDARASGPSFYDNDLNRSIPFNASKKGRASESFYLVISPDVGASADNVAITKGKQLAAFRQQTLGFGAEVAAVRIEVVNDLLQPQYALPVQYMQLPAAPWVADLAAVKLYGGSVISDPPTRQEIVSWSRDLKGTSIVNNIRAAGGTSNPLVRTKRFMAFVPDIVAYSMLSGDMLKGTTEKLGYDTWYSAAWKPWAEELQGAGVWAIKSRVKEINLQSDGTFGYPIIRVTQGDPTATPPVYASVTLPGKSLGFVKNSKIQIKGRNNRRFHGRQKELNGFWQVFDIVEGSAPDTTTLFLICTIDIDVDVCKQLGRVFKVAYAARPITGVELAYSGSRRRGD